MKNPTTRRRFTTRGDIVLAVAMAALAVGLLLFGAGCVPRANAQATPETPAIEAPTFTLAASFEGPVSCLSGWTLVSAEPVWRVPYIPNRGWAAVDATEGELRAAYTRPTGTVDEPRLAAAQGRYRELTRVTCRYAPLSRGAVPAE